MSPAPNSAKIRSWKTAATSAMSVRSRATPSSIASEDDPPGSSSAASASRSRRGRCRAPGRGWPSASPRRPARRRRARAPPALSRATRADLGHEPGERERERHRQAGAGKRRHAGPHRSRLAGSGDEEEEERAEGGRPEQERERRSNVGASGGFGERDGRQQERLAGYQGDGDGASADDHHGEPDADEHPQDGPAHAVSTSQATMPSSATTAPADSRRGTSRTHLRGVRLGERQGRTEHDEGDG